MAMKNNCLLRSILIAAGLTFSVFSGKADNMAYLSVQTTNNFGTINLDTGAFSLLGTQANSSVALPWRTASFTLSLVIPT
jgi:hypothetical protein